MYAAYFGLRDYPFSITPDPSYVYMSPRHQEALAHLLYGMGEHGGFVQLTGEVGTGKTTLIRTLLSQHFEDVDIALSLNPRLTVEEFMASICDELHIDYPQPAPSLKQLLDALNRHLLEAHAKGRRTVLIIDEAQNLSREVLEQVRLLTNLETHRHKLLRIILVGQPELDVMLKRDDLRQLAQRITARYHLQPLNARETTAYVSHRLSVAGAHHPIFSRAALRAVYRLSHGVPRLINVICDRALLAAYAGGHQRVDGWLLRRAAREALRGPGAARRRWPWLAVAAAGLGGLAIAALLGLHPPALDGLPLPWHDTTPAVAADTRETAAINLRPAEADLAAADPEAVLARLATDAPAPEARLSGLWGLEAAPPAGAEFCSWVRERGLRCLDGPLEWGQLQLFDLPAVLTLDTAQGRQRVLLRGLRDDRALLAGAEDDIALPAQWLAERWNGDYLLLWRPALGEELIGPHSRGEAVRWLRRQLALAAGQPLPAEPLSDRYDPPLQEAVRRFQQTHGLTADGLVGARTQIVLGRTEPAPTTPTLAGSAL
ncbi:MAG TPA: AAA family ATPase [Candidatus Competibacteraceae bacterium]|nr:AAA family ATPase [Candidatus Competibacteraceae bacterium]